MDFMQNRRVALRDALVPPHPAPSRASRGLAAVGPVIFAIAGADLPRGGLRAAHKIADLLQRELHVLCILPLYDGINPLAPRVHQLLRALNHRLEVEHSTRVWLESNLGFELAGQQLQVRYGDPLDEIAAHARELAATMVVVPCGGAALGNMVTALAREAHLPILAARDRARTDHIIAATDLRDGELPVLRTAAELGSRMNATVTALHNVCVPSRRGTVQTPRSDGGDACARRLHDARRRLEIDADIVVTRQLSTSAAILHEAHVRDVDLIVLGAHARSWRDRWRGRDVTAEVTSGAEGSVLVTPLEPRN